MREQRGDDEKRFAEEKASLEQQLSAAQKTLLMKEASFSLVKTDLEKSTRS